MGSVWLCDRLWLGHVGRRIHGNHLVVAHSLMLGALATGLWAWGVDDRNLEVGSWQADDGYVWIVEVSHVAER